MGEYIKVESHTENGITIELKIKKWYSECDLFMEGVMVGNISHARLGPSSNRIVGWMLWMPVGLDETVTEVVNGIFTKYSEKTNPEIPPYTYETY